MELSKGASEYRKLVQKLEELELPPGAEPEPGMSVASAEIPVIDAPNFNAAYAQAKKQGLKKFKWCGTYAVKDAVKGQAGKPLKPEKKVDYLGQETPLGGTMQNPMSFAPNSNFGA